MFLGLEQVFLGQGQVFFFNLRTRVFRGRTSFLVTGQVFF